MPSIFGTFGVFDPLDPWLGAYGPRSLTGRPRGSPGGLPTQAREASPFALTRERVQNELQDNPQLQRTLDQNTTAEVGTDPAKRRWYQALTVDRAVQTGKPLSEVVNNPDYYPPETTRKTATSGQQPDDSLWEGANPANYATGNASYDQKKGRWVGFAGGPQTSQFGTGMGRELGGIEGQAGLPYARAMGYTGPDRTAIGPEGPSGNPDDMIAGLQGGGNAPAIYPQPERGKKMPASLMDFLDPSAYQARDPMGRPTNIGDAIASRSNSLIGMGAGLLGMQPLGSSGFGQALQGYQKGAVLDETAALRKAQLARQAQQDTRETEQDKLRQSNFERQFARSDPANTLTDFGKMMQDEGIPKGSPEWIDRARKYTASKIEGSSLTSQFEQRKAIAKANGMDENDPRTKAWIAAGGTHLTDEPKALPAELAARTAVGGNFLDQAPALRKQIESGMATSDPIAKAKTFLEVGEQGSLARKVQSGADSLLRHMTGAGMSLPEAQKYIKRYEITLRDTKDSALDKFDQLTTELTRIEQEAYRGRGGVPRDVQERRQAGQGAPATAAKPATPAGETKTIGGKTYRKVNGQWFED